MLDNQRDRVFLHFAGCQYLDKRSGRYWIARIEFKNFIVQSLYLLILNYCLGDILWKNMRHST